MARTIIDQGKAAGKAWRLKHLGVEGDGIQMDAAHEAVQKLGLQADDDMDFYTGWYRGIDEVDEEQGRK